MSGVTCTHDAGRCGGLVYRDGVCRGHFRGRRLEERGADW